VEDAADPAPIWVCDRTLNSPPVVITFSTGARKYSPPPENLDRIEVMSLCEPEVRAFHLRTEVKEPLKVLCDSGTGSTIVDVFLREDPVACCPSRLLRGIALGVRLPPDLEVVRFLPGELNVFKMSSFEGPDCWQIDTFYMPSPRFGEEKLAVRIEVGVRPGHWPDGFLATDRELRLSPGCDPDNTVGAVYLDERVQPFAEEVTATIRVLPHCPTFRRGDVDGGGGIDIGDAIGLLTWMYQRDQQEPLCFDASDANDDGRVDIGDPIFILSYLFASGPRPPAPGPDECGSDPTGDSLDCEESPDCQKP
jgi:hypothetical protein